jgi:predicted nuclease with RNAse H fold
MPWQISDTIARAAAGLGIARDNLEAEAARVAEKFPDAASRESALLEWVHLNMDSQIDAASLANTLAGIVRDVLAGIAGKDPRAHQGNV